MQLRHACGVSPASLCRATTNHIGRNSSAGRALDWRSKGPWFDPGFRHFLILLQQCQSICIQHCSRIICVFWTNDEFVCVFNLWSTSPLNVLLTQDGLWLRCVYVMSISYNFNGKMYFHIFTQTEAQNSK